MKSVILVAYFFAAAFFGMAAMRGLDQYFAWNRQAADDRDEPGKLRIAFSEPFVADSAAESFARACKACARTELYFYAGDVTAVLQALREERVDVAIVAGEANAGEAFEALPLALSPARLCAPACGLSIAPLPREHVQSAVWKKGTSNSLALAFVKSLPALQPSQEGISPGNVVQ